MCSRCILRQAIGWHNATFSLSQPISLSKSQVFQLCMQHCSVALQLTLPSFQTIYILLAIVPIPSTVMAVLIKVSIEPFQVFLLCNKNSLPTKEINYHFLFCLCSFSSFCVEELYSYERVPLLETLIFLDIDQSVAKFMSLLYWIHSKHLSKFMFSSKGGRII